MADDLPLSDARLTEDGLEIANPNADKVLLIACGALAREILALSRLNGWDHFELTCLPAKLHLFPDQIPDAVRDRVAEARGEGFTEIKIVYADCGTGGLLDNLCEELGVERIEGPHCYSFFDGNENFAGRADEGEITSFYLTDFLVKQFDAFVWKPMGLDRHPELRDMIFGNYEKLIYLSQIDDPALVKKAAEAAERLGLAFEHRHTGYGDLEGFLARNA
ncbi:DUF1638 domain-containing protein [Rhodobacteraceae bacterium NNCM2]|nr:DUF1638 domain-containing protein [Coraliihabitans acroporae]